MGKDGAGASRDQFVIGYCRGSSAHGSGPRTSPKFQMSVASRASWAAAATWAVVRWARWLAPGVAQHAGGGGVQLC